METRKGEVEQILQMVGGDGEYCYAANSSSQRKAIIMTKSILENVIEQICKTLLLERITIVELGCSSGPNTLLVISQVLDMISKLHEQSKEETLLEIQFILNDLPSNDFNSVFRSLEEFKKKIKEERGNLLIPYYVSAVPGSFHGRLLPSSSVHFFHSSYSLHWLSQVPKELAIESAQGIPKNKGNIYISKTSPPETVKAYREQFQSDFSSFLKSRYEELCVGGGMVLTFLGRDHIDNDTLIHAYGLLAEALNSMVIEEIIPEEKWNTFNLPLYAPLLEEVKSIILSENSFHIEHMNLLNYKWHEYYGPTQLDTILDGKTIANVIRAVFESLIAYQFGNDILDELFKRYAEKISKSILRQEITNCIMSHVVLVLTKKAIK